MDYTTEQLILHYVTEDDLTEVARTWPSDHHPLSEKEARDAISYMQGNYARNTIGCIYHLCLAVCRKEDPDIIMGWCGFFRSPPPVFGTGVTFPQGRGGPERMRSPRKSPLS